MPHRSVLGMRNELRTALFVWHLKRKTPCSAPFYGKELDHSQFGSRIRALRDQAEPSTFLMTQVTWSATAQGTVSRPHLEGDLR